MRKTPRNYTEEFRKQAVTLARDLNSVSRAAEQLGISTVNIYEWKKRLDGVPSESIKSTEISGTDREELMRLRKEVSELKKVNHILKSAAAFFSQDHLK
jgi:transposase